MDANNQNNPGEAVGNNVDQLPAQPRQPQNLQVSFIPASIKFDFVL